MGHKILVVEDDDATAKYIVKGLAEEGFVVDRADNGRDGLFHATDGSYACIVLDRMLPVLDGISVLKALRAAQIDTPVLVLSALASVGDRIEGLESGSDDYLVKPFSFAELLARVNALLRRREAHCDQAQATANCAKDQQSWIRDVDRDQCRSNRAESGPPRAWHAVRA